VRHRLPWLGFVLSISLSIGLGACDHKPAPKQKPAAAAAAPGTAPAGGTVPAAPPAGGTAPVAPSAPPAGAGVAPGGEAPVPGAEGVGAVAQACMQIGVRVADLLVASAGDAVMKAQLEQARADTVRSTAEACMRGKWDAELRQCFLTATTRAALDACSARAPGPGGNKPTPGS